MPKALSELTVDDFEPHSGKDFQLAASNGTLAAHAKTMGLMDQAERFHAFAESDRQFDLDLSSLAKTEVNPQALDQRAGTAS